MTVIVVVLVVAIFSGVLGPQMQADAIKIVDCMKCAGHPTTCRSCE
jgi:hypothetical protein